MILSPETDVAQEGPRRRHAAKARRWLLHPALGLGASVSAVWACLFWVDAGGLVPVLQGAYAVVPAVAAVAALLAMAARRRRTALVAGLSLLLSMGAIAPTWGWRAQPATIEPGRGRTLTVVAANVFKGQADEQTLSGMAMTKDVDVLVLPEASDDFIQRLRLTPVWQELPYVSWHTPGLSCPELVLSRYPMSRGALRGGVVIEVAGRRVEFRPVHTAAPVPEPDDWRRDLTELRTWKQGQATTQSVVMAGDFNAGWAHPGFREIADGLTDALQVRGRGWHPTWPNGRRTPAFTQIDHILVRGVRVMAAGGFAVAGSDHLAVWARLDLE